MIVREADIGGARVLRTFTRGGEQVRVGQELSRAEVLAIPTNNRQALIDGGKLGVFPPSTLVGERFAVHVGLGRWQVYEGRKLTEGYLTKEEAAALAAEGASIPGEVVDPAPETPN